MVIISTRAVEASIQAVSPVSIFGPSSAMAGAAASSAIAAPASTRAGILIVVVSPVRSGAASAASERRRVGLAGADAERRLHVQHEDLAVADLVGAGGLGDGLAHRIDQLVRHDDLDLDLRQEAHLVLGAP